jgi:ribonuclease HI
MAKKKNNFFVVWDGHEPGIYSSWEDCKKQTHGFGEAKFKSFATMEEAREAFCSPYWDYVGKNAKAVTPKPTAEQVAKVGLPNPESIAVDAACSGNPGPMEYRGVYTKNGTELFKQGPYPEGSNNIGEFLAIVHALALLKQKGSDLPIYTDSMTALAWLRIGKARTRIEKTEKNAILFDLLARAEKWLAENKYTNNVLKWETEVWGEIPADFGRKFHK